MNEFDFLRIKKSNKINHIYSPFRVARRTLKRLKRTANGLFTVLFGLSKDQKRT